MKLAYNKRLISAVGLFTKLIPKLAYPVVRGPLKGIRFVFGSAAGVCGGASLYINKAEPQQLTFLSNTLKKNQIFFDVGANIGLYTMLGSRLVGSQGKVIAIEPNVRNVSLLYRHTQINKTHNVIILPAACTTHSSLQLFATGVNCATGHVASNGDLSNLTPVPSISLDELAEKMQIMPDVVKIDVEGAEMEVLKGALNMLQEKKPAVFLSTHSDALRSSCISFLQNIGYQITPHGSDIEHSSDFFAR